jgi:hypothetical protein
MAYVGRSPKHGFLEGQTATFNGSTTVVTLLRSVSTTDALDVYIDNVHQEPDVAYTLSSGGSAITFTGTPANGQKLYIRFHGISFDTARAFRLANTNADSTLTLTDSHTLTLDLNGTTALTATASGITIPNLTVTGTTTSVNSTNLEVGDNQIILNSDVGSGVAPSEDAGIVINRGSSADVAFLWDEGEDYWLAADPIVSSTRLSTIKGGTTPTIASSTVGLFQSSASSQSAALSIIANSGQSSILNFGDENDENAGSLTYNHSSGSFALTGGNATFSGSVDAGAGLRLYTDGSNNAVLYALGQNKSMYFTGDDAGVGINALVLDMANGGNATFNGTISSGAITSSGNLTVSGTLNGITTTQSASGNRWGVLPEVASNGVLEIGRYVDFHATDGDTSDYGARFDYDGSKMILTSDFQGSGTIRGTRLGGNADPNANYAVNALQNGSMTHAGYFQANGDDIGVEIKATASSYSSTALLVQQSTVSSGGFLARFANASGNKVTIETDGTTNFAGNIKASDIIASGSGGLALQTDEGTKRLLVKDNGEVKIGTTAVASATTAPLHVAAPSTDVQAIFGDNTSTIDDPQIRVIGRNTNGTHVRYLFTGLDADANHGFIGYNAGAGSFVNGLEFNTDGVVTAPKLPAFRAARDTSDYSHTTGNPVQFNTTGSTLHFDTGNDYSTTNYRFTAPVAGVYTFHCVLIWTGLSDGNSMIDSFRFRVNGSTLGGYSERRAVYKTDITGTAGYFVESATDTYKLSAGDYVEVIGQKSLTIHANHQYTRFTGYLVG